jgi:SAM-dependent methyltransferase
MVTTRDHTDHDWRAAGQAWGSRANDWSCLYEHYSIDVVLAFVGALELGPATALLDIACGSGVAIRLADATGAAVSGIDASSELVEIARLRTPRADVRVGSMFALPWADETFTAAWSVNGIWGGCQEALDEAFRVLRPGGRIGISFWGQGPPLDIRDLFRVFARRAPDAHRSSMRQLNDISVPGVAETMLVASGFEVVERGARTAVIEWPDEEIAWRAISSLGPAQPALREHDHAVLRREVAAVLERCRDERGVYRTRSEQCFVVARKPAR